MLMAMELYKNYIADNWIMYIISQQVTPKQMYILRFLQRKTNLSSSEETLSLTIYAARFLLSYCNVTQRNSNVEQLMATKLCRTFINIKWILHCPLPPITQMALRWWIVSHKAHIISILKEQKFQQLKGNKGS